jgi:hypothetical protein
MLLTKPTALEQESILISVNLQIVTLIEIYPVRQENIPSIIAKASNWIDINIRNQPDFIKATLFQDSPSTHIAYYGQFRYDSPANTLNLTKERSLSGAFPEIRCFSSHSFSVSVNESKTLSISKNQSLSDVEKINHHYRLDKQRIIYINTWEDFDKLKSLKYFSEVELENENNQDYEEWGKNSYHKVFIK